MNNDFESLITLNTNNLLSEFGTELLNEASSYCFDQSFLSNLSRKYPEFNFKDQDLVNLV